MQGWKKHGNVNVIFLAQFENQNEIHDGVVYHCMKKSLASRMLFKYYDKRYGEIAAENKKQIYFMPDVFYVNRIIRDTHPDLVILRSRRIGNAIIYLLCRQSGIRRTILYTQNPIYSDRPPNDSVLRRKLFPTVEFSPVLYTDKYRIKGTRPDNAYFVPLVAEAGSTPHRKRDKLRFLDVGKYRDYKNHFFIVDAVDLLPADVKDSFELTIVGQCKNKEENAYFDKLQSYISDKGLNNQISLKRNIPFQKMADYYNDFDVLLLASKKELTGMVILEAMAQGLCVISSIYCGLACYLEEFKCGYTFDLDSPLRLTTLIEKICRDPALAYRAGEDSQKAVSENFSFKNYLHCLNEITKAEFQYDICEELESSF